MLQEFSFSGSHYEFGFAIGKHFAEQIHKAYDTYSFLNELLAYHQSSVGQERFDTMLSIHEEKYPQYLQELQGMAKGAERSFTEVFLVNLRGEYRGFINEKDEIRGCADCSLLNDGLAIIGHNEDGSPVFRDHMYIIHAKIEDNAAFTACSYPGFLCGNAFGFNAHGICFSVDNIRPENIQIGIARHFLARSLLDAKSINDAIQCVTPEGRASGFSYTIGSIPERRIVQLEVTPDQFHIKEIRTVNFHANHVLEIPETAQTIDTSSACRVARARAILNSKSVEKVDDILAILGDQTHSEYPIYRSAKAPDPTETFCTALFDLDMREMRIYSGHPVAQQDQMTTFNMQLTI